MTIPISPEEVRPTPKPCSRGHSSPMDSAISQGLQSGAAPNLAAFHEMVSELTKFLQVAAGDNARSVQTFL